MMWNSRTNPIIASYRRALGRGGADLDVGRFASGATISQIQHASKVFDRLAYLGEK